MAGVGAPWPAMGSSPERGKRGKEEGSRGALLGVWLGEREGCRRGAGLAALLLLLLPCSLLYVRRKQEGGRRKREETKRKEKK
jgi:hypothetical protein